MIDKEKLRIGLEEVSDYFFNVYRKETDEYKATKAKEYCDVAEDALSLLKEQEPKPMLEIEDDDLYAWSPEDVSYYCPRPECGKEISYNYKFCPYCGQAVKLGD